MAQARLTRNLYYQTYGVIMQYGVGCPRGSCLQVRRSSRACCLLAQASAERRSLLPDCSYSGLLIFPSTRIAYCSYSLLPGFPITLNPYCSYSLFVVLPNTLHITLMPIALYCWHRQAPSIGPT